MLVNVGDRSLTVSKGTFREKTVVVTGASSGIGRALALRLAIAKVLRPAVKRLSSESRGE